MSRDRRRVMLEAGYKLGINGMKLKPNCYIELVWRYSSGLLLRGCIRTGPEQGTLILSFGDTQQWIELTSQPRRYGGVQFYFLCPRTDRRVSTLWMPPGATLFASRHAWPRRVAYRTQFEDRSARAWTAKRKIARRLGSADPNDHEWRGRPRGMRMATYERLSARYEAAEDVLDHECALAMNRLLMRYGRGVDL